MKTLMGLAFGLALLFSTPAEAQIRSVKYGYVIGEARDTLAALWDTTDPYQVERIYQVVEELWSQHPRIPSDSAVFITKVVPCEVKWATPSSVHYRCPDPKAPTIHVHTPTTCYDGVCIMGGDQSYDANPSRTDREEQKRQGHRYDVVQVAAEVFVFWFNEPEVKPRKKWLGIF